MFRDDSWCFVMVRHGSSWFMSWFMMFLCHGFVMVRHGSSWFTVMVHCHGSSWFTVMVRHGSSWFTVMVHHGSSWFTVMVCHGSLSWFVMVRHGSSWFTVMVRHGSSWFVMVHCHGFVMVRHGSSWFVMCYSLKFSRKGHVTLNSANQSLKFTIKSHFWWDFLFSPFHLKSIPLKSSAKNLVNRIVSGKEPSEKPYYLEGRLLKKYIYDNKQRFEVTVVPPNCAAMLLNLAHDQMGHNGSARTYMLLKRLYYWKGMKTDINIYVKQCKLCQRQNIVPVKYSQGHFTAPMTPMEFISMDLIGDLCHPQKEINMP